MSHATQETNVTKKKGFLRKHLFDFLLLGLLVVGTGAGFLVREATASQKGTELTATLYLEGNLMAIPGEDGKNRNPISLSQIHDYQEIVIQGRKTTLTIGLKHNAIAVVSSRCPGQECVHVGWVSKPNHPIVCAHNGVFIEVVSSTPSDEIIIG